MISVKGTKRGLSKAQLQYIAVAAMAADHLAAFVHNAALCYIMQFIGRITVVIMCMFIAEGYYRTRSVKKYAARLALFAAISQIPFCLYVSGLPETFREFVKANFYNANVIFTLLVGLCLLAVLKGRRGVLVKLAAAVTAYVVTRHSDWGFYAPAMIVAFGFFRDNRRRTAVIGGIGIFRFAKTLAPVLFGGAAGWRTVIWSVVQLGMIAAVIFCARYNGKKGKAPKYFFYVFYPAHLLFLAMAKIVM